MNAIVTSSSGPRTILGLLVLSGVLSGGNAWAGYTLSVHTDIEQVAAGDGFYVSVFLEVYGLRTATDVNFTLTPSASVSLFSANPGNGLDTGCSTVSVTGGAALVVSASLCNLPPGCYEIAGAECVALTAGSTDGQFTLGGISVLPTSPLDLVEGAPAGVSCVVNSVSSAGASVTFSWTNNGDYDEIGVVCSDGVSGVIAGNSTSFTTTLPHGSYCCSITARQCGIDYPPRSCCGTTCPLTLFPGAGLPYEVVDDGPGDQFIGLGRLEVTNHPIPGGSTAVFTGAVVAQSPTASLPATIKITRKLSGTGMEIQNPSSSSTATGALIPWASGTYDYPLWQTHGGYLEAKILGSAHHLSGSALGVGTLLQLEVDATGFLNGPMNVTAFPTPLTTSGAALNAGNAVSGDFEPTGCLTLQVSFNLPPLQHFNLPSSLEAMIGTGDPPGDGFLRGDSNNDGTVNIADAIYSASALFAPGAPAPPCLDAADANDDGQFNIADVITIANFLFTAGSPSPPAPFPNCGDDPTPDALECVGFLGAGCP